LVSGRRGGVGWQSTKEPGVDAVLEQLERGEALAMARVEDARAEALSAADRLDAARIELSNLVIARLTVAEVMSVGSDAGPVTAAVAGGGPKPGVRGAARDEAVYARIRQVFTEAGRPLRVKAVCERLGLPDGKNATESVRSKLRRLADDGELARIEDGLFVLAGAGAGR
jgi:hypothetical protein